MLTDIPIFVKKTSRKYSIEIQICWIKVRNQKNTPLTEVSNTFLRKSEQTCADSSTDSIEATWITYITCYIKLTPREWPILV